MLIADLVTSPDLQRTYSMSQSLSLLQEEQPECAAPEADRTAGDGQQRETAHRSEPEPDK